MNEQTKMEGVLENDVYMTIWQADQKYVGMRWNVTAFFLSISFAVLAFSFQVRLVPAESLAVRICALFIYCFACVMYWHYSGHTHALRLYLLQMEASGRTTLDLQSKIGESPLNGRRRTTSKLLLGFGALYVVGIIILSTLGL